MALTKQFTHTPLRPAYRPDLAVERPVRLPVGGKYGVGGKFAAGLVLGCVGGAASSAVWTLTISGSPTGSKITLTYVADQVYTGTTANLVSAHASVAQLQAVCDAIFGVGNTLVAGTPGTSFTITFQNQLASARIGGNPTVSATFTAGSTPAIALARTTPGSCGSDQFDVYDDGTSNNQPGVARAALKYDHLTDPLGSLVTEQGSANPGGNALTYMSGFFNAGDLSGLDAAALSDPGFRLVSGAAITDPGAVVAIGC